MPIRPAAERTHRLVLEGQLVHDTAPELEAVLDELWEEGIGGLVLDVGALTAIDLTGMGVIAMRCELCRRRGIAVGVDGLREEALAAFAAAGLLDRLPLVASESPDTGSSRPANNLRAVPPLTDAVVGAPGLGG